jgi:D-alanine--poly(phosphoribitol) ligase subunit 1
LSFFERIVAVADPTRPGMTSSQGCLTYGQLLDRARVLAAHLAARRSPVLIFGHKQPAMVVGILAALRLGRAYVPVDSSAPAARIARMIEISRPGDAILAEPPPAHLEAELRRRRITIHAIGALADDLGPAGDHGQPAPDVSAESPAYILFTSGTTGDPKGVPVPYRALAHFAGWLLQAHGLVPTRETFLNQAPFSFDLSVMDLYGALLTGGTLFCLDREDVADPRQLFARLATAGLTVWVSTPSFARFCLAEPGFDRTMLPDLRLFLFCGETLPPAVVHELARRFPRAVVWNTYGPTETTVAVTGVPVAPSVELTDAPLSIGRPFPGMDVWIADPDDPARRLPDGQVGEMVIAGPQVALGYLLAPGATAGGSGVFLTLPDGRAAYRTGDRGHVDPADGLFYWDGRGDRQIKLHGYRIELEEIEAHLRALAGIADAAVLTVDRGGHPDHLVAFVVANTKGGASLPNDEVALAQQVRGLLAVRRLTALPLTTNGKLDRRALAALP